MNIIEVKDLSKIFKIPKKKDELGKLKRKFSFFYREWKQLTAVDSVNFNVKKGEILGYIGPNGAGKSTTIKMLTGILHPTSGLIKTMGFNPHENRNKYTKNIGVVFGQRSSLDYDIPIEDSYELFKAIYDLSDSFYVRRLKMLSKLLDLDEIMSRPYRLLSLGQKMRAEIASCFIHKPKLVFLDEPTIGLDADAKIKIREFLKEINKKEGVTIIITTHDMDDIEELCKRIILIDEGKIAYDGDLKLFRKKYANAKNVFVHFKEIKDKNKFNLLKKKYRFKLNENTFEFELKKDLSNFISELVVAVDLIDLTLSEAKLENIVAKIYSKK